jgi:hypothetical protein
MDAFDLFEALGFLIRAVGVFLFGLGVGWLVVRSTKSEAWQLTLGTSLGMMAVFVLTANWVRGGATLGALGLGAGAGLLIWGLAGNAKPEKKKRGSTK